MVENYSPDEKFLTQEFTLKRDELGDWLTNAMWEGLKDCFRTPICEEMTCGKDIGYERVVGFVRTLYVDPENNFVTFEGLFGPSTLLKLRKSGIILSFQMFLFMLWKKRIL